MRAPPDEARRKQERRERFAREAKHPPPPVPVKRIAHPGGKIVSSDKDACLMKLIARKQAAGEELSDDQRRALQKLPNGALSSARAPPSPAIETVATTTAVEMAAASSAISAPRATASEAVSKRTRTLRKKMHEIEELERRAAEGAVLQENQRAKLATKEAIAAELAQLEGADGTCARGPSAPVSARAPCGCCS